MELYFAENVSAIIIPERQLEILPLFDRWNLYVTPAQDGYKQEAIQCRTRGSGDPHFSWDDVRFDTKSLTLHSCVFHIPEANIDFHPCIGKWLETRPVIGLPQINAAADWRTITTCRYISAEGDVLMGLTDEALKERTTYLRLHIAPDVDLLFAKQRYCGWMISHPVNHLHGEKEGSRTSGFF